MATLKSVCVYCGSGEGSDPAYGEAADALGAALAGAGIRLVYGGGSLGLMGRVARACLDHGGQVTGIIPGFLHTREVMLKRVTDLIITEDMHQRKRRMFEEAEAFVALPGGIGTLEELVEMLTWSQLGRHKKPVLIADIKGFWAPLLALLDHMRGEGFIRSGYEVNCLTATRAEDILPMLQEALAPLECCDVEPSLVEAEVDKL
ncbi:MAG: TIGR00730 family Rossman fold protein [Hyphomicrobiaceae bacterium]|nr:TIGR00730 family Rossman fold protein [Hyphomicrobiaceae bacterium]